MLGSKKSALHSTMRQNPILCNSAATAQKQGVRGSKVFFKEVELLLQRVDMLVTVLILRLISDE